MDFDNFGHNSGSTLADTIAPDRLQEELKQLTAPLAKRCDELSGAFERWKTATKGMIDNAEMNGKSADFVKQVKVHVRAIDTKRVAEKEPFLTAGKTVDAFFKAMAEPMSDIVKKIEGEMTVYAREVEKERRRVAEEAAAKARAEAAEAAAIAERTASLDVLDTAIQKDQIATQMTKAAAAPAAEFSRSRGDLGAVGSLRSGAWLAEITDKRAIPVEFMVLDIVAVRARADQMKKDGMTDEQIESAIPGLRVYRESKVTVV
jgi:regulator of protease activity HflC (stomatin/prohibitin superfamily)